MSTQTEPFRPQAVHHVLNPKQLDDLLGVIARHVGYCVLDLETTDLNEHWRYARVVTASLTLPVLAENGDEIGYPKTYVIGLSHPDAPMHTMWRWHLTRLTQAIKDSKLPIIGQNIRFDVRWLTAHTGVDLVPLIHADTGMSLHLMDENQTSSLKPRAMAQFGIPSWIDFDWKVIGKQQEKDLRYPHCPLLAERVDYFTMAMYNARDTYYTWRLHQLHEQWMGLVSDYRDELMADSDPESTNMLRLGSYYQKVSVPAVRTITRMEQRGMMLDKKWCYTRLEELSEISGEAYNELHTTLEDTVGFCRSLMPEWLTPEIEDSLKGDVSFAPTALWFKAWANLMCREEKLRVIALTPTGQPCWSKAVLNRLSRDPQFSIANTLLTYRKATKQAEFIRSWLDLVGADGRIHPTFNYYRTVTGRLSCSNPNLQQVPREAQDAFCAAPGFVLVSADYSQIEMRVAAHVASCDPMLQAFREGKDLHTLMASMVAGIPYDQVTKEQRQAAKAINFGFLFGMQAHKFVTYADDTYDVLFTHEEAEDARKAFFSTWDGLQAWHNKQINTAAEQGYVKSPLGRIRHNPDALQAINSPVQGMASDMMTLAAGKISRTGWIHPVALVHDAVKCEVPEDRVDEATAIIGDAMENIHGELEKLGCKFQCPLKADIKIG